MDITGKNMAQHNRSNRNKEVRPSDLPPTDYDNLDDSIRVRLIVEIFHNMGCMSNKVYFTKYDTNAEALDRDYSIWKSRESKKQRKGKDT